MPNWTKHPRPTKYRQMDRQITAHYNKKFKINVPKLTAKEEGKKKCY